MIAARKSWEKPQLIVLTRARPEEAVLITCKHSGGASGPTGSQCRTHNPPGGPVPCEQSVNS